jgi:hypothetical protein
LSASIVVVKIKTGGEETTNLGYTISMVNEITIPPWRMNDAPPRIESSIDLHSSLSFVAASFRTGKVYIVDYEKWSGDAVFEQSSISAHPRFCSQVKFHAASSSEIITTGDDGVKTFDHRTGLLRQFYKTPVPVSSSDSSSTY